MGLLKLVMTLLVRDEIDIVSSNIAYHKARGVDHFVVTDNLSRDGTAEFLMDLERDGLIDLIHEKDDTYAQSAWVSRMAQIAAERHGADWIVNSDVDEFWWPAFKSLKDICLELPVDVFALSVARTNFLPPLKDVDFPLGAMTIRRAVSKNMFGKILPPKVMHRAATSVIVSQGNHSVSVPSGSRIVSSSELEILHFPLRAYSQFENKISNGGAAYGRNATLSPNVGRAWRILYQELQDGKLRNYYDLEVMSEQARAEGLYSGDLIQDCRLLEFLRDRNLL